MPPEPQTPPADPADPPADPTQDPPAPEPAGDPTPADPPAPPPGDPAPEPEGDPEGRPWDEASARAEIERVRRQSARYRGEALDSRAVIAQMRTVLDDAELDDATRDALSRIGNPDPAPPATIETLQADNEGLRAQLAQRDLRDAVRDAAAEHGADFELTFAYLSTTGKLEALSSAEERQEQASSLVKQALEDKPNLTAGRSGKPRKSGTTPPGTDPPEPSLEDLSDADYIDLRRKQRSGQT